MTTSDPASASPTPHIDAAGLSAVLEAAVQMGLRSTVRVDARSRHGASGVVWDTDLVLTADHVLERDEDITIIRPDGEARVAQIAGRDPGLDLAVLRVPGLDVPPATQAAAPRLGQLVLAIGRGGGAGAAMGIVAEVALGRRWRRGTFPGGYIRPDLTMYPGFSGGPLVDAHGHLLGMNTTRFGGMSMTVPSSSLASISAQILAHGRLRRAWLGLRGQHAELPDELAELVGQSHGLVVIGVDPGSPAAVSGVQVGDILISVSDQAIFDSDDLRLLLTTLPSGEGVTLTLLRGGNRLQVDAMLGER